MTALPQLDMIERVKTLCRQDERLVAAMMYGSFTRGEGDEFSDIEFLLFFADEALPTVDPRAWVEQIALVALFFVNEFGIHAAVFANLVRGEFHFDPASSIKKAETWRGAVWFPSVAAALIVDRSGELSRYLAPLVGPPRQDSPSQAQFLCDSFLNWTLFGTNVLARGEVARAAEILRIVQDDLLKMARLLEGRTEHWITPTKCLESEISPGAYARYISCSAAVDRGALGAAYRHAWRWGREMMTGLAARYPVTLSTPLLDALEDRILEP